MDSERSGKSSEARRMSLKEQKRIGSATSRYLEKKSGAVTDVILETEESSQGDQPSVRKRSRSKRMKRDE